MLSVCVALGQLFGILVYHFKLVCLPLPLLLICFHCPSRQSGFQGNGAVIHYAIIIVPSSECMAAGIQTPGHTSAPALGSKVEQRRPRVDQKLLNLEKNPTIPSLSVAIANP